MDRKIGNEMKERKREIDRSIDRYIEDRLVGK